MGSQIRLNSCELRKKNDTKSSEGLKEWNITTSVESNKKVYPSKQCSRLFGSASLTETPSTVIVGEKLIKGQKKAYFDQLNHC